MNISDLHKIMIEHKFLFPRNWIKVKVLLLSVLMICLFIYLDLLHYKYLSMSKFALWQASNARTLILIEF